MMIFLCLMLTLLCGFIASNLEHHYTFLAKNKYVFPALLLAGAGCIVFPVLAMFFAFQYLGSVY